MRRAQRQQGLLRRALRGSHGMDPMVFATAFGLLRHRMTNSGVVRVRFKTWKRLPTNPLISFTSPKKSAPFYPHPCHLPHNPPHRPRGNRVRTGDQGGRRRRIGRAGLVCDKADTRLVEIMPLRRRGWVMSLQVRALAETSGNGRVLRRGKTPDGRPQGRMLLQR